MSGLILIEPTTTELAAATGPLSALEIRLGGVPRGVVVLLTDPGTPEGEVVESMNSFAMDGYESLAVSGDETLADAVFDRLRQRGWENEQVGVVGLGRGATVALEWARRHHFGAAVSLSPAPDLDGVLSDPSLSTPWLGLIGAQAHTLGEAEARRLASALDAGSDVFSQVVVYPGVTEDFYRRSDDGLNYAASYDGRERVVEWLNARVAARLTPLALAWRKRQIAAG